MKTFTTLMATSAAVLGLAGSLTAVNADNVTMSKLQSDTAQLSNTISQLNNNSATKDVVPYDQFGSMIKGINDVASNFKPGESRDQLTHDLSTQAYCGGDTAAEAENDVNSQYNATKDAYTSASDLYSTADKNADTVLEDLYALTGNDAATASSNSKADNDVKAPAQNTTTSSSAKANNDVKAPAQQATTSNSSSKANNDVKAPAQNTTTSNSTKANNGAKNFVQTETNSNQRAQQGNANVENTANNKSNATKVQNKDAIVETQNENTTAAAETSRIVKTQAKTTNNTASQNDNTPVFPQTGESGSTILAVAGGMIIAMTAAGVVVYKKRN